MGLKTYALAAIGGAALVAAGWAAWNWHGTGQYKAGYAQAKTDAAIAAAALSEGIQYERDRADAIHRGAVLAREAAQKDTAAVSDRLDRLLRKHRDDPETTGPGGGSDGAGVDGIGVLIECVREYASVGTDAARLADKVGGLQGYIKAITSAQ